VRDAKKSITNIQKRGKIPIICGGTGFWVQALIEGTTFPPVKPDLKLRKKLSQFSAEKLFSMLEKKDSRRAKNIDRRNKVRLIRALEIISVIGRVPPLLHSKFSYSVIPSVAEGSSLWKADSSTYGLTRNDIKIVVLNPPKEILRKRIEKRLKKRLSKGMIAEVKRLKNEVVSWKRLESFGLEYKNIALFLQKKISRQTMYDNILREIFQYAKRQLTWLRRWEKMSAKIQWVNTPQEAETIIKNFLKRNSS
jgi:tRNA dimethylallyltransferase